MVDVSKIFRFAFVFEEEASGVAPANVDEIISGLWDGSPPGGPAQPTPEPTPQPTPAPTPAPAGGKRSGFEIPGHTRARTADAFLQQKSQELLPQVARLEWGAGIPFVDSRTGQQYLAVKEEHPPKPTLPRKHPGVSLFISNTPPQQVAPTAAKTYQGQFGSPILGIDPRSQKNIAGLDDAFKPQVMELMQRANAAGLRPVIVEGRRSQERQNELWAQGRTTPGKIVTKTKHSAHTKGLAVDIYQLDENGKVNLSPEPGFYDQMAQIARPLGIMWGGDWKGFKDRPHFQFKAK